MKNNKTGFTLIEVLVVLIILGVMASLAIPIMSSNVNRTYRAEALGQIDTLHASLTRYFSQNGGYPASANLPITGVDYDPTTGQGGQIQHFTYALTQTGGGTGYKLTANTVNATVPVGIQTKKIVWNSDGTEDLTGTGTSTELK